MIFPRLASALLLTLALSAQPAADVISGVVVTANGNAPLSKVLVTVAPAVQIVNPGQKIPSRFAITGADGRFTFLNIPPGKYQLSAARPHDRPQLYLSNGDQYSTAIVTGAGVDTTQLVFPYHAGGAIHGTVVDEGGEPIRSANAHLFRQALVDGRSQYAMAGNTVSHADGSFHFSNLAAGTYFVGVTGRPWFATQDMRMPGHDKPEFDVAFPLTYYPAATDFSAASPIAVTEGNSAAIQVSMRAVPAVHPPIVRKSENSSQLRNFQFFVAGLGGFPLMNGLNILQTPNGGSYSLPPGRYQVVDFEMQSNRQFPAVTRSIDVTSDAPIELGPPPKINVSGAITIEGTEKPANKLFIMLRSPNGGWMGGAQSEAASDGTFNFQDKGLQPGRYQVQLSNTPAFFLKSITAKGAPLSDGELELTANSNVQLSLVIAPFQKAVLNGFTVRNGQPTAGAMVLLLPTSPGQGQLIRRDQSDLDGSFTLLGVAPGTYRLIAVDNGRDFAFRDPAIVKPYLAAAKSITIGNTIPTGELKVEVQSRKP